MTSQYYRSRPFDAVRAALAGDDPRQGETIAGASDDVRPDGQRIRRTGIPEVVLAESKSLHQVVESLTRLVGVAGRAMASRCPAPMLSELPAILQEAGSFTCVARPDAAAVILIDPAHPGAVVQPTGGSIGVITAGTSDIRVAAEAGVMAAEMGCRVIDVRDVGVAGLHRLVRPLEALVDADVAAIIVVAGMDGALPSVVAGLVDIPVIGVPSSVGYGHGGGGEAALMAMLQSCAPGLVVVNIDNGIGAGAAAARIANRQAARVRT